jgi:hypothetical protein
MAPGWVSGGNEVRSQNKGLGLGPTAPSPDGCEGLLSWEIEWFYLANNPLLEPFF